ncbi:MULTISPECIES: helix-turn-helix transcriptional regulator [Bacteria]|uniref:helix-turn-helix transcriptional regulator n=1 Tax=Bacteria TaxID=2 RepID=UPI003C7C586F
MIEGSARLLSLLSLFQVQRDWSGPALAYRLGVSVRTVRRDVERLRAMGYDVDTTKGPEGGYRLGAGKAVPPLLFDDDQAIAVAVALQSAPATGVRIDEAAERALATVRQVMPPHLRHRMDAIRFVGDPRAERVEPDVLDAVSDATRNRMTLRFGYRSDRARDEEGHAPDDAPPRSRSRRAEPHAVVSREGRWYMIAWDLDREGWRIFRLDRVSPRPPFGPPFLPRTIPGRDARAYLSARFKGSAEIDRWPCVGEVALDVPAAEAARWLPEAEVEELTEQRCRVVLGSWSWSGVLSLVLRFGAPFSVLSPPPLRAEAAVMRARLTSALSDVGDPA